MAMVPVDLQKTTQNNRSRSRPCGSVSKNPLRDPKDNLIMLLYAPKKRTVLGPIFGLLV